MTTRDVSSAVQWLADAAQQGDLRPPDVDQLAEAIMMLREAGMTPDEMRRAVEGELRRRKRGSN